MRVVALLSHWGFRKRQRRSEFMVRNYRYSICQGKGVQSRGGVCLVRVDVVDSTRQSSEVTIQAASLGYILLSSLVRNYGDKIAALKLHLSLNFDESPLIWSVLLKKYLGISKECFQKSNPNIRCNSVTQDHNKT